MIIAISYSLDLKFLTWSNFVYVETAWLASVFSVLGRTEHLPVQPVLVMVLSFLHGIVFVLVLEELLSHLGDLRGEGLRELVSLLQVEPLLLDPLREPLGVLEQVDL